MDSTQTTLTIQWGREPLPVLESAQVNYLVIDVQTVQAAAAVIPLNLCLVLDRSGSMQGAKITALRAAVARVIERLSARDILSVIVFDEQAELIVPATAVTDAAPLQAAVAAIQEQGGTALSQGLLLAQQQVALHAAADRLSRVVILTDGQTWGDEEICRTLAGQLAAAGVPITAFGLGAEWNAQLLEDLAAAGNGRADYIDDAAAIDTFFQQMIRSAQSTTVQQARLVLRPLAGVEVRAVHRVRPLVQQLALQPSAERTYVIGLGDIAAHESPQVLCDLLLPARPAGEYRLMQLQLIGTVPGGSEATLAQADVLLRVVQDAALVTVRPDVMNLAERVSAFKLQTRALHELEVGQVVGATRSLRAAATRLLDLGEVEHAAQVEQQADRLEQQQQLTAEDEKALRYKTRRLTQRLDDNA